MPDNSDKVSIVYQRIWRGLVSGAVPHLFEGRCAWLLTDPSYMFVLASEGAPYDAGLVVDKNAELPEKSTERLFHVLDKYRDQAVILPMDCKTISPELTPSHKGLVIRYSTVLSSLQQECAIILLQNPAAPHLISVCPLSYLASGPAGLISWPEIPLTAHYTEPFPPALSPTVMPIQFLNASMQAARDFFLNPGVRFFNPYTNVTLEGISPWKTVNASTLLPSETSHLRDIKIVHLAWNALRKPSSRYNVERMMVQPSVGDFLILDHETKSRVTVEVKQNMAVISETGHLKVYMADRHGPKKSTTRTFAVFAKPDFYLLTMERDAKAIFAPSSFFPDRWSYEQVVPGGCYHWDPPPDALAVHVVELDKGPLTLGIGLTKILDRYNSKQGLLRAVQLPFESEHFTGHHSLFVQGGKDLSEKDNHVDDDDAEYMHSLMTTKQPPRQLRGTSGRWSRKTFNAREEHWLRQQCLTENYGALYYLGRHPSGAYAFAPGSWYRRVPLSFNDLSPDTDMLFINFAPTSCLDTVDFHDVRRPLCYFHATHGTTPSIFILSVHHTVPEGQCQGHIRYIIPSQLLADDPTRRQLNNIIISKGWKALTTKTYLRLRLSTGEPIDVFAVREEHVVKVLKKLYRRLAGSLVDPTLTDILDLHRAMGVNPELYIVTRREILRQFMPVLLKQSFLDRVAEPEEDD